MTALIAWLKKWGWLVWCWICIAAGVILALVLRRSPPPPQAPPTADPYRDLQTSIQAREQASEQQAREEREAAEARRKNQESLIRLEAARRQEAAKEAEALRARYATEDPERIRQELLAPPPKEGGWVRVLILAILILGAILALGALSCLDGQGWTLQAQAAPISRPVCLSRDEAAQIKSRLLEGDRCPLRIREQVAARLEEERIAHRLVLQRWARDLQMCRDERARALSRPPCPPAQACSCVWPVVGAVAVGVLIGGGVGVAVGWVVR